MAGSGTIKDFLVGLGFKIDEASFKKFSGGLASASEAVAKLTVGVEAAAVAVGAAVTKMADAMEELHYASKRTGAAVSSIQGLEYAAGQMGVAAGEARGSLEGLARFMRSTPGSSTFINSLGVATKEANGEMRDTTEIMGDLGKKFKSMPYYQAKAYSEFMGIDENTLRAMIEGMGEFGDKYKAMYKAAGVDSKEAAENSKLFMNELRTLGTAFTLLWQKVTQGLLKTWTPVLSRFRDQMMGNFTMIAARLEKVVDIVVRIASFLGAITLRIVDWFVKLDAATDGWSTALAAALVAWRLLNLGFMLTPIGAIITALVALGAAIVGLVDDYMTWKEGGQSLIDWSEYEPYIQRIKDTAVAVFDFFKRVTALAIDGIVGAFKTLRDWFEDFINWFREKWEWIEDKAERAKDIAGAVADGVSSAASTVKEKADSVMSSITESEPAKKAMSFFQKMGWSKEQSAGLAANIQAESGGKANAVGDNGKAYGIAQWHPDRQRNFEKFAGKRMQDSSYQEQLAFMHHELTEGTEKSAGNKLRNARSAGEAGSIVSAHYERPSDREGEMAKRARLAEQQFASASLGPSPASQTQLASSANANVTQKTEIKIAGVNDPQAAGQAVVRAQAQVNNDLVRNMKGAIS